MYKKISTSKYYYYRKDPYTAVTTRYYNNITKTTHIWTSLRFWLINRHISLHFFERWRAFREIFYFYAPERLKLVLHFLYVENYSLSPTRREVALKHEQSCLPKRCSCDWKKVCSIHRAEASPAYLSMCEEPAPAGRVLPPSSETDLFTQGWKLFT